MIELTQLLKSLDQEVESMSFSETIRHARDTLGLRQYKVAIHLGISPGRLKNLETGYFRVMPRDEEIGKLSAYYHLSRGMLEEKAEKHVRARRRTLALDG